MVGGWKGKRNVPSRQEEVAHTLYKSNSESVGTSNISLQLETEWAPRGWTIPLERREFGRSAGWERERESRRGG